MSKKSESELKVGLFLSAGIGMVMIAILVLGGTQDYFAKKNHFTAHFNNVEGLIAGAKVILGGVGIGIVDDIRFDNKERDIVVDFSVRRDSVDFIRKDSTAEIATQGVLGDKYVKINPGNENEPVLEDGSNIPHKPTADFGNFLNKSDQLLATVNKLATTMDRIFKDFEANNRSEVFFKGIAGSAKNLSVATEKLNKQLDDLRFKKSLNSLEQILEKINNGTGTLGQLINDPGLYDEMRSLMGGANRNRVLRNLVRQTIRNNEESKSSTQKK